MVVLTGILLKKKNSNIKTDISVIKHKKEELKKRLNQLSCYKKFAVRVKNSKKELIKIFNRLKDDNKKIIGYGATAKSTTILNYCKINQNIIDYFLDTTKDKQGKFTPGTKIPILKYKGSIDYGVDYIFLGAWNFKEEIFKKTNIPCENTA